MKTFFFLYTKQHRYQEPGYEGVPVPLDGSSRSRRKDDDMNDDGELFLK